jgi:hypothetical protein
VILPMPQIKDVASLKGQDFTPASKKLILNMDDLGILSTISKE